jgi:hypothetical protein
MPGYFLRSHEVRGQAEIPDISANHPLVSGSGPFSKRRGSPPPPAMMVHIQDAIKARLSHHLRRATTFVSEIVVSSLTTGTRLLFPYLITL